MATGDKNTVVTQGFVDKLIDKIGKILKEQHALVERDDRQEESIELLLEKISLIEKNFEELTKSLALGSYPLKLARSIKVTESSIAPKIVPVDLTKAQLIETYNELVAVLSGYVIPVTSTPDSYRGSNSDGIILETTVKGNYWAITTLEDKQHKYWLVPNSNLKFNIHKLKTVENLFQLTGNYNSSDNEFILQEPAILSLLPDNKQWKLIQPGVLFFDKKIQSISPQLKQPENMVDDKQSKINLQISSSFTVLQTTIDRLTNKITQLEICSELSQKTYQRDKQEWLAEKQAFNEQLQKTAASQSQFANFINQSDRTKNLDSTLTKVQTIIEQLTDKITHLQTQSEISQQAYQQDKQIWLSEINNFINQSDRNQKSSNKKSNSQEDKASKSDDVKNKDNQDKIDLKTKITRFRQDYSQDIKLISNRIVAKVAISVETLEQITFHKPDVIKLENTSHGKYWIIDYFGAYFLIPSEIQQITNATETSLTVAKILFELVGYYPQYSSYHLIKPATVTKLSANQWKLEEKGKFNFS